MLCFLYLLLVPVNVFSETYEDSCSSTNCSDLDFENCENECCDNSSEAKIIVCYFTNWAWYRSGIGKFMPENINASLCTHIIYAFASLDPTNLTIGMSDSWADIDNDFFKKVVAFKGNCSANGPKVLISLGGWNNSGDQWKKMVCNATARAKCIQSILDFMDCYGFDGLDVDWEYPGCPKGIKSNTSDQDAVCFYEFIKELKAAFVDCGKDYLLTMAMAGGETTLNECYKNITELCCTLDWINVMTYEYHSYADGEVGACAPICGTNSSWGVRETIEYLITVQKCPPRKLTMGIPFYGQSYKLYNASNHGFGDKVSGAGDAGQYTSSAGTLAFYEICLNQKNGWKTGWNKINGSYAWNDTQLVTFDSTKDIKRKCCLINKYFGLRGAMFWTLDYDDFTDSCDCGVYPLLKTLNQQLRCLNVSCTDCY